MILDKLNILIIKTSEQTKEVINLIHNFLEQTHVNKKECTRENKRLRKQKTLNAKHDADKQRDNEHIYINIFCINRLI